MAGRGLIRCICVYMYVPDDATWPQMSNMRKKDQEHDCRHQCIESNDYSSWNVQTMIYSSNDFPLVNELFFFYVSQRIGINLFITKSGSALL